MSDAFRVTWFAPPDRPVEGCTIYARPAVEPETAVHAPESAAERLAAPAEGSGHPRPAERRSGTEAP